MMCNKVVRAVSRVLYMCIFTLLLVGCSHTSNVNQDNLQVDTGKPAEQEKADPLGKYTPPIEIRTCKELNPTMKFIPGNPDAESMEKNVWSRIYEEELGIKLKYMWVVPESQSYEKWSSVIASRNIPDAMEVPAEFYKVLLDNDMLEDMTDYIEKYASAEYKQLMAEDEIAMKSYTRNGRIFGVPSTGTWPAIELITVRTDWLKKLNLPEPKTMEDVYNIARAFAKEDPDRNGKDDTYGLATNGSIDSTYMDLVGFFNGYYAYVDMWMKDSNGSLVYSFTKPEFKLALDKLQNMYKEGIIDKDFARKTHWDVEEDMKSGKIGMYYGIYWTPGRAAFSRLNDPKAEWKVYEIPVVDGKKARPQGRGKVNRYYVVRKGYEHPEALVKLANIYIEKEIKNRLPPNISNSYIQVFKYALFRPDKPWPDIAWASKFESSLSNGDTSGFTEDEKYAFNMIRAAMGGNYGSDGMYGFTLYIYGPGYSTSIQKKIRDEGRILTDNFFGLLDPELQIKLNYLRDNFYETILKVIMGASIDEWDKAVEDWERTSGGDITEEVNRWYRMTSHEN